MSKRPRLITADAAAKFLVLVKEGHTFHAAAAELDYHRTAFNKLAERDEEFRQALAKATAVRHAVHVDAVMGEAIRRVEEGVVEQRWELDDGDELVLVEERVVKSPADVANAMRGLGLGTDRRVEVDLKQPIQLVSLLAMAREELARERAEIVDGDAADAEVRELEAGR